MKRLYNKRAEAGMINFYDSLSEKDKRRYAALEVQKLFYGGQKYICDLLGCDPKTIQQGLFDLENEDELKKTNKDRARNNFLFLREAEYWIGPFGSLKKARCTCGTLSFF